MPKLKLCVLPCEIRKPYVNSLHTVMCFRMFTFWMAKTFQVQYKRKIIINLFNISFYWRNCCQPSEASPMNCLHLSAGQCTGSSCTSNSGAASSWETQIHCSRHVAAQQPVPELVMGHFFKILGWLGWDPTQPKISGPNPTHKSLHPTQPTHHRHLVWHIRLYQKLYTTTVTRHRQVHSQWKLLFSCSTH